MPRYVPASERRSTVAFAPQPTPVDQHDFVGQLAEQEALKRFAGTSLRDPYHPDSPYSYFRDLLTEHRRRQRLNEAVESVVLRGRDPGEVAPTVSRGDSAEARRIRLKSVFQ